MSSILRYAGLTTASNGAPLSWNRAEIDGLPFRGPQAPMLREDEFYENTVTVADVKVRFFDMDKPQDLADYTQVMERAANQLYTVLFIQRFLNGTMKHYVEWAERYIEPRPRQSITPNG